MGRKDEMCLLAMRALSLETISRYGREYALTYTDGSSTGGAENGGYGIYFLWPDGSITRICGPVGNWTCSYECELIVVTECLRVVIEKQREGAALPGVVIFTDCRALVWALGGSGSEGVGEAVLLADYLLKTEGVQTVVQWIPSHVGVVGNEIADGLANERRSMPQPRKSLTLSDARSVLQRGTARLWSAAQLSNDERFPHFYEAYKAGDYLQSLPRSDAVQISRARAKHTLLLAGRADGQVYPNAGKWPVTALRHLRITLCYLHISLFGENRVQSLETSVITIQKILYNLPFSPFMSFFLQ
ncbi:RNA-directed DNA polymerase from [Plakobranchus ocellatus]|uniref:RNA-directed DNA polymerase from n=1 Tax=Plakobranchus ocellatus TaxID=259542 RepID=A0AAV3YSD5_9GAST|nr:RNA-directed DNA polymerase from [Plakobranchus ocellatus]